MKDTKFQERDRPHDEFSEYFNDGYILAKNNPELLNTILWEIEEDSPRSKAMLWGRWFYENEKQNDHLKEFGRLRDRGKDTERDLNKDW